MTSEPTSPLTGDVKAKIEGLLLGSLSAEQFEQWVYDSPELEAAISRDDHLALLSLIYSRPDLVRVAGRIVDKYVDHGALETARLRELLLSITTRDATAHLAIEESYDKYCRGYSFLDKLALEFGLAIINTNHGHDPTAPEHCRLMDEMYPAVAAEAQRVLQWLADGRLSSPARRTRTLDSTTGSMMTTDSKPTS